MNAGIPVPEWRIEIIADKPVLLLRRFDREQEQSPVLIRNECA